MERGFVGSGGRGGGRKINKNKAHSASNAAATVGKNTVVVNVDSADVTKSSNFGNNNGRSNISEDTSPNVAYNTSHNADVSLVSPSNQTGDTSQKSLSLRILVIRDGNGVDVVVSKESVSVMNERLSNIVYGFFLGKHVAYSVVENYSVIATKLNKPLMLDSYTAAMCTDSWSRASYARAMVKLQAEVELEDTIVVAVSKFVDVLKNLKNPRQVERGVPVGQNVGFKQTKQVYRLVSQKNSASTSGKNSKLDRLDKSVIISAHGSSPVATGSPNTTILERINNLERKMLDGKLMLVDDDGKPLNKVDYTLVNSDSDSDVEVTYDETTQFMASEGANDASLYDGEDYDIYDTL
ncbi:hypothetical protein Tco_0807954 [Tanacetum coccineum]